MVGSQITKFKFILFLESPWQYISNICNVLFHFQFYDRGIGAVIWGMQLSKLVCKSKYSNIYEESDSAKKEPASR